MEVRPRGEADPCRTSGGGGSADGVYVARRYVQRCGGVGLYAQVESRRQTAGRERGTHQDGRAVVIAAKRGESERRSRCEERQTAGPSRWIASSAAECAWRW